MRIIKCPSCQRRLLLPADAFPRSLQCPACFARFKVATETPFISRSSIRGPGQEGNYRTETASCVPNDGGWRLVDDQQDMPHLFADLHRNRREGSVRKALAIVGFASGTSCGLFAFAQHALHRNRSFAETLAAVVLALVLAPLIGIVLAALGAGFGQCIEVLIRLLKRRRGESVLLTLVGEERDTEDRS